LAVDERKVVPTLVAPKNQAGAYRDYYHCYHVAQPSPGRHTTRATIHNIETQAESSHTVEFTV